MEPRPKSNSRSRTCRALAAPAILVGAAGLALAGCSRNHTLETGYQYQPLNSSSIERRAFYADPYSIEARRAQAQRQRRAREAGNLPGLQ